MISRRTKGLSLLTGIISGFLGGLLGIGGAFIVIPALISLMSLSRHKAHGTSLAIMTFMAVSAASLYAFYGNFDLKLTGLLLAGGPLGVIAGARVMHRVSTNTLGVLFGVFVVLVALKTGLGISLTPAGFEYPVSISYPLIVLLGAVTGCLAGLLGVGGAVITIPGLVSLAGVSQQTAQGISLLALIPTALLGSYTHWKHGLVDVQVVPWILASSLAFSLCGAYLANSIASESLTGIFSMFMMIVGVHTLVSGLSKRLSGRKKQNQPADKL